MYASTFTIHLDMNCLLSLPVKKQLRFLFLILKLRVIDDKNVCLLVFALAQVPMFEKVVVGAECVVYLLCSDINKPTCPGQQTHRQHHSSSKQEFLLFCLNVCLNRRGVKRRVQR